VTNPNNQGARQDSVRAVTGTTLNYDGDWARLFTAAGVSASKDQNGRLLSWINVKLGTSYTSLPTAQQAFAVNQGFNNWSSMGAIVAYQGKILLRDASSHLLMRDGVSFLALGH
jgi:hypothetical protein